MYLPASTEPEPKLPNGLLHVRSIGGRTILALVDAKACPKRMRSRPRLLDHLTAGFLSAGFCPADRSTPSNHRPSLQRPSATVRELRYRVAANGAKYRLCHPRWQPRCDDRWFWESTSGYVVRPSHRSESGLP